MAACSGGSGAGRDVDAEEARDGQDPDGTEGADEEPADAPAEEDAFDAEAEGLDAAEEPETTQCDLAGEPAVESAGETGAGRYSPLLIRLDDGRVLIAGGYDFEAGIQASAEIFDPADLSLAPAGTLVRARNFAAWAPLPESGFLVTGGFHPVYGSLTAAEVFDPDSASFRFAANGHEAREAHTATALPDGRIVVAGGLSAVGFLFHGTCEIFDPVSMQFRPVGDMRGPRAFHAAVYLPAVSKILVVGGDSGSGELATLELFDPETETFEASGARLSHYSKAPTAVLLDDGRVLVAGGANATDGTLDRAWLYDPESDSITDAGAMHERRMAHAAVKLADGRVMVAGGWSDSPSPSASTGSIEVFDPETGDWEMLPVALNDPRHDHAVVLLDDCRVLAAGGQQVLPEAPVTAPAGLELITAP